MLLQTEMICQWFEYMGATGPHVAIVIDAPNEHAQFSGVARAIYVQDCLYFLFPKLKTSWCKPITKPFSFLDGPFTFQWVYGKSILM